MRKLASIREVKNIRPIEGRDMIEQVNVDGWNVIVKKGEFKEGDLCVYVEIDSEMPQRPEFEFLKSKNYIIKTMKMAGVRSEGIVFPLSILPKKVKVELGKDVTKILGITQYNKEPDEDTKTLFQRMFSYAMRYPLFRSVFKKTIKKKKITSTFPHWIRKTDEERIQNKTKVLAGNYVWTATEKIDGCSATFGMNKDGTVICSRNQQLFDTDNVWYKVFEKYDIQKVLNMLVDAGAKSVVIQGEIIGPKIQGNKYKVEDLQFYVFNVIMDGVNLSPHRMIADGIPLGLPVVPVVYDTIELQDKTVEDVLGLAHFMSNLNKATLAEGLVFRTYDSNHAVIESFKAVNPLFLIQNKE